MSVFVCVMQVIEMERSFQPDAAKINLSGTDAKITGSTILSPLCAVLPHGMFKMPLLCNECSLEQKHMTFFSFLQMLSHPEIRPVFQYE